MRISNCLDCNKQIVQTNKRGVSKKYCSECGNQRNLVNKRKYQKAWNIANKDKERERKRKQYEQFKKDPIRVAAKNKAQRNLAKKLRKQIISHYGGKCVCCGEEHIEFLAFDHIDGKGNEHRRLTKYANGGIARLRWIIKNNYPPIYRLLCHNCNMSIGFYGYCPHRVNKNE